MRLELMPVGSLKTFNFNMNSFTFRLKEKWSEENNLQEERKKCIKTVISDSFHS